VVLYIHSTPIGWVCYWYHNLSEFQDPYGFTVLCEKIYVSLKQHSEFSMYVMAESDRPYTTPGRDGDGQSQECVYVLKTGNI